MKNKIEKIKKGVQPCIDQCRESLVKAIIDLCRETGKPTSEPVQFTQTLLLRATKPVIKHGDLRGYATETVLCDKLLWGEHGDFFFVEYAATMCKASYELSIDNLIAIYNEMLKICKSL